MHGYDREDLVTLCKDLGILRVSKSSLNELSHGCTRTLLGKGDYGTCWRVVGMDQDFVVKKFHDLDSCMSLIDEVTWLNKVHGIDGVQDIIGVVTKQQLLITHYTGQSLSAYCDENTLDEEVMLTILSQLATVLHQIACCHVSHNDIREDNICVREVGDSVKLTVIDFGVASAIGHSAYESDTFRLAELCIRLISRYSLDMPVGINMWIHRVLSEVEDERPTLKDLLELLPGE